MKPANLGSPGKWPLKWRDRHKTVNQLSILQILVAFVQYASLFVYETMHNHSQIKVNEYR